MFDRVTTVGADVALTVLFMVGLKHKMRRLRDDCTLGNLQIWKSQANYLVAWKVGVVHQLQVGRVQIHGAVGPLFGAVHHARVRIRVSAGAIGSVGTESGRAGFGSRRRQDRGVAGAFLEGE